MSSITEIRSDEKVVLTNVRLRKECRFVKERMTTIRSSKEVERE